ncbi:MAG: stage V sporulation protein D [Bacillota bacterium]
MSAFFIFMLIMLALVIRLVWIQIINSEEYQNLAMEQRLRNLKVEPKRGNIFDRTGEKLAVSASSQTVVGIPYEIDNPEKTARTLAQILDSNYNDIFNKITKKASAVYIERKIEEEKVAKIRSLDLKGIIFTEESKRHYPNDYLASHILGFSGIDSQGLDGIELSYDKYLKGSPGKISAERDAAGRSIPGGIEEYDEPEDGYNIYLTIDEVIQYIVERELDKALKDYNISGGTIIVMDPKNGGILALANRPNYDPNNFKEYQQKYWRNRAISDSFEPGSTFKIITTASSLEEGAVDENDIFVDPGFIKVSGERIDCWKWGGHGRQTFKEVVQNSCNPGFVQVGMRLGKENFYNYINAFGFGQKTEINLPGETDGLIYEFDEIGPVELATISFGHGITVTPIQLTTAVSAVANDGMLMQPRLVEKINTPEGKLYKKMDPVSVKKVISTETAVKTRELLENVVADGTGTSAQIEGYRIGGKTGTAKHYGEQVYDSSFVGIVPVDDPRLVISVVLYDVSGEVYYGSQTAAPVFKNVALDTLRYLEIPPQEISEEESKDITQVKVPDVKGMEKEEAATKLRNLNLKVKIIGDNDEVLKQVPLSGAEVNSNSTILLFTEEEQTEKDKYLVAVPDLTGLNEEEAVNLLAQLGLELSSSGSGKVIKQEIEPGTRVEGGTVIEAVLKEE